MKSGMNEKCSLRISKQRMLQPSRVTPAPRRALRELRMETNRQPTAKPSATAATPSGAP